MKYLYVTIFIFTINGYAEIILGSRGSFDTNILYPFVLFFIVIPAIIIFIQWYFKQKKLRKTLKKMNDSSHSTDWKLEIGTSRTEVCSNCGQKNEIFADKKLIDKIFLDRRRRYSSLSMSDIGTSSFSKSFNEMRYPFKCSKCGSTLKNISLDTFYFDWKYKTR